MTANWLGKGGRVFGAVAVIFALLALRAPIASSTTIGVTGDPNPSWPDRCGINAALLIDHSNSIKNDNVANPGILKDAAKAFASALQGTPSRIAVHSFWKTAHQEVGFTTTDAAGVATIGSAIDAIPFSTSDPNGSTNWDEGFRSVESIGADVVVILTDGNPTVHLNDYASGGTTDQADIDEGVKSANRVKGTTSDGKATRIVAVGIGGNVAVANLKLISGPNSGDDYFATDYASLSAKLKDIASKLCGGTVVVHKQAQQSDGSYAAASGWAFSAALAGGAPPAVASNPADGVTNGSGDVNFHWSSPSSQTATITEQPKLGYALASVVCTKGQDAFPSDLVANGVKLTVGPTDVVTCVVKNKRTAPGITVVKTVTGSPASIGDTVHYSYTITNSGNLDLSNVKLTDDKLGVISIGDTTLSPGDSTTGSATHVAALGDLPGPLVNVATAVGTPPSGPDVSDTDNASVSFKTAPAITIVKSAVSSAHPGDNVTYSFLVTNTGDVTLTNIKVTDDKLGDIGTIPSLAAGAHTTLTKPAPAPADDVTNVGKACGTDPLQKEVCDTDDHHLDVVHPSIQIVKTGASKAHQGENVTYSFEVTNTGDVTLSSIAVTDDVLGSIGTIASLAPGAHTTLTKTVPAPADDVTNVGKACGSDPLDKTVCDTDDHHLDVVHPSITIVKDGPAKAHEGDSVGYSFLVTNTGDVTLTNIKVTDDKLGDIDTIPTLAPGAQVTLTKTVTAPADDVTNVGKACGSDPLANTLCDTDDHHLDVIHPAIQIVKDGPAKAHEGDNVTYSFDVTNTGDVTLTSVAVTDDVLGAIGTIPSLAPGAHTTLSKTVAAPADDVTNIGKACGSDPLQKTVCDTDDHHLDVIHPAVTIDKTAASQAHAGDDVTYTFTVTNTGDVALTDIAVTDDKLGDIGTVPSLAPGAHTDLTKTAPAPADDLTNVGKVCVKDPLDKTICDTDDHHLDVIHPAIHIEKSGPAKAHEGNSVTYTFTVTNTGDVALTGVDVTDDKLGAIGTIPAFAAGAVQTFTKTVAAPADDVTNVATACGDDPLALEVCDDANHVLDIVHPAIALDKTVNGGDHATAGDALVVHEGDPLHYSVVITNTGDTPLLLSTVVDTLLDDIVGSCGINLANVLNPGANVTCTWTSTASADESGQASTEGADLLDPAASVAASDVTFVDVIHPALTVTKSGPAKAHEGDELTYTFVAKNTGDVALSGITVTDDKIGAVGTIDSLAPGAEQTFTKTFTVPAGSDEVTNVATACGNDPLEAEVCGDDTHTATVIHPAIKIVKTADEPAGAPRKVTFSYAVTNTGDATLAPVVVTDDVLGDVGTIDSLAPGETKTLTKSMDADENSPTHNVGTAVGTDELGRKVTATDAEDIAVVLGVQITPPPRPITLPRTGAEILRMLMWGAALLLAGAFALVLARRLRRRAI